MRSKDKFSCSARKLLVGKMPGETSYHDDQPKFLSRWTYYTYHSPSSFHTGLVGKIWWVKKLWAEDNRAKEQEGKKSYQRSWLSQSPLAAHSWEIPCFTKTRKTRLLNAAIVLHLLADDISLKFWKCLLFCKIDEQIIIVLSPHVWFDYDTKMILDSCSEVKEIWIITLFSGVLQFKKKPTTINNNKEGYVHDGIGTTITYSRPLPYILINVFKGQYCGESYNLK